MKQSKKSTLQPWKFATELGAQPTHNKSFSCARASDVVFTLGIRKSGLGKVVKAHTHRKAA